MPRPHPPQRATPLATLRLGALAGLAGGCTIWLYELVVWVHFLRIRTVEGLLENSAVLVFGPRAAAWPHPVTLAVSALVHFATAAAWGALFALLWPALRRRAVEATLAALFYGVFAWVVMHNVVLAALSPVPPSYTTYVVLNGLVSHTFAFSVPVALLVKRHAR
jgi:hypothetical protein